jgi:hypothetical protein
MTRKLLGISFTVLLVACTGEANLTGDPPAGPGQPLDPGSPDPHQTDPYAPCTDRDTCCTSADVQCTGDPDNNPTCTCTTLWDCSQDPSKCEQDKQVPTGGGTWTCEWTEQAYTCKGGDPSSPPGGSGWNCENDAETGQWICTKQPPNPANTPGGTSVWKCKVENGKIVCVREGGPPPAKHEGNCADGIDNDGDGKIDCQDADCPPCKQPPAQSGKEICDGKDNNGDGRIDEGNVCANVGEPCPPGAYQACDCYCGVHRKCKPDGTWGPCKVDGNSSCQIAQVISHSQCPYGMVCDYGECIPESPFGWQCKKHTDCPQGQVCDLGECIKDMYYPCP